VYYSGSVSYSYPASQNGGTGRVSYSGTAYEDVQVNIDVETTPFDNSVAHCNSSVNVLTGAVVATEAAQIASIDSNAKKIGGTIVEGFFKTIRSEISQQISELSSRLDATLIHLNAMAKRCVEKQRQMAKDYNGISNRYIKIFTDLNNELSNRIYELDKPTFVFKKQNDSLNARTSDNDLVSTVAIFGAEGGDLQAYISASVVKKRALDTIGKANVFLLKQKRLNRIINQSMLKESLAAIHYSPVCFMETRDEGGQIHDSVYQSGFLSKTQATRLTAVFKEREWGVCPNEVRSPVGRYLQIEVNKCYSGSDAHSIRVKENIARMLDFDQIESV
jgi:hypothetical protein